MKKICLNLKLQIALYILVLIFPFNTSQTIVRKNNLNIVFKNNSQKNVQEILIVKIKIIVKIIVVDMTQFFL